MKEEEEEEEEVEEEEEQEQEQEEKRESDPLRAGGRPNEHIGSSASFYNRSRTPSKIEQHQKRHQFPFPFTSSLLSISNIHSCKHQASFTRSNSISRRNIRLIMAVDGIQRYSTIVSFKCVD